MIRITLAVLTVILFFIVGIITLPLFWIIGRFDRHRGDLLALRAVQAAFKVCIFFSGTKADYIGLENIPEGVPVMYIGNHRGFFDILLTYIKCPDLTGYISKKEILKVPVLPIWMRRLYCLFLDRDDIRAGLKVINTAISYVKSGISVFVFPEGTRNKQAQGPCDVLPFKDGSFRIAAKTGCPIIPVAITGTADVLENHLPRIKPAHVIVRYGEPIYMKDLSKEDRESPGEYFRAVIVDMLGKNENLSKLP